jgi:hypothetical protein
VPGGDRAGSGQNPAILRGLAAAMRRVPVRLRESVQVVRVSAGAWSRPE